MSYFFYTVQQEDRVRGLHGLARWFYGTPEKWVELYRCNRQVIGDDPLALRPGQQLIIPCDLPDHTLRVSLYRVQPGDFRHGLPGIAARYSGDTGYADRLYQVNRGVIGENPNLLQIGQVLVIP